MGQLPWVDERQLAADQPLLFHYTSESSLAPILESGGMFATHFDRTNDRAEAKAVSLPLAERMATAAYPRVVELARQRKLQPMAEAQMKKEMIADAVRLYDAMLRTFPTPPHITCFSAHSLPHHKANGLLTMWRLYGSRSVDGNNFDGIALGFNTEKLRVRTEQIQEQFGTQGIYLTKVLYGASNVEVQRRVDESPSLASLYSELVVAKLSGAREPPMNTTEEDADKFLSLIMCAKHEDFEDERETRLVVCPTIPNALNGRTPLAGPEGKVIVKYLDALEVVMVGPSGRQDDLFDTVTRQLQATGFGHVQVTRSGTPYRSL